MKRGSLVACNSTGQFLVQRAAAVLIVVYTVLFVLALLIAQPFDHSAWQAFFAHTWLRVATMIFLLCVVAHAWVGMRDILMDYIKPAALRLALYALVLIALAFYLVWGGTVLWRA
jgi:succinate dehydrogenase / fumarate reductase membrane anchor subunit